MFSAQIFLLNLNPIKEEQKKTAFIPECQSLVFFLVAVHFFSRFNAQKCYATTLPFEGNKGWVIFSNVVKF